MKKIVLALLTLMYLLPLPLAIAKNVGVIGPVYPIAETDFLQWVQTRLQEKTQSGELAHWQAMQAQTLQQYADRPTPVTGLTPAQQTRSWLYDPTLTLTQEAGEAPLPVGTHINPLDRVTWTKTLLFYDADDAAQVAWAIQMEQQLKGQIIFVLTQGSVVEQTQEFKKPVYFDQGGQLVQRFGITYIPAYITQAGKQLRITEVKL